MPRKTKKTNPNGPSTAPKMQAMERFIRAKAQDYLSQPNINSVGIGYKSVDGKPTDTLAIQFSVDSKVAQPQAIGSEPIPETISFEGVTFDTDVVERSFKPHYVVVQTQTVEKDVRKQRLETILPGVSVGNARTPAGAGTIGAIVVDKATGAPVILSNWHVLHTATGVIGDPICQPGSFDDNRVLDNRIGALLRSHLGVAGDCAIASIEVRAFTASALGIDQAVGRIGKAELGDKVVKSGRTTGVTRGVVTRVSTVTRLNYGDGVVEDIGGFEIGPDPAHPAPGEEISKGGDSGASWMAIGPGGEVTDIMLGLHFGGDADGGDGEFALAAQAHSVFEKLEIAPFAPLAAAQDAAAPRTGTDALRRGFDPAFLGEALPLPTFTRATSSDLARLDAETELKYCHFSSWLSVGRRLPRLVAWNIDGNSITYLGRKHLKFRKDERGDLENSQLGDELYANNPFDRGHVARRADLCWGTDAEAKAANFDSFYFTNQTPQHQRFNQSKLKGKWGELENAIFDEAEPKDLKVSLFAGPVLGDDDPRYRRPEKDLDVQIPVEFFKIVMFRNADDGVLALRGFMLTQRDLVETVVHAQTLELEEFRWFQLPIATIGKQTGLRFPAALGAIERLPAVQALGAGQSQARLIRSSTDFFA